MKDNEIIKTWEWHTSPAHCNGMEIYFETIECSRELAENTLDLINRLQAENEKNENIIRLADKAIETANAEIERLQMDNKQLQSDVINANQNWEHIKGLWECEKEKVESAKQKVICTCKMLKTAKSEAIKEFARELKCGVPQETGVIRCKDIDNLVKKMTEVQK